MTITIPMWVASALGVLGIAAVVIIVLLGIALMMFWLDYRRWK